MVDTTMKLRSPCRRSHRDIHCNGYSYSYSHADALQSIFDNLGHPSHRARHYRHR